MRSGQACKVYGRKSSNCTCNRIRHGKMEGSQASWESLGAQRGAWVAEVCEGSVQGRQVWAGRCQAFLEHPVRCILLEIGSRI